METQFITPRQVTQRIALSRATLDRMVAAGTFPKPIRIGHRLCYVERQVQEWIEEKATATNEAAATQGGKVMRMTEEEFDRHFERVWTQQMDANLRFTPIWIRERAASR